jgi:aspartate 4-decarboxylase
MSLFAAFALLDKKNDYKTKMQSIISSRLEALWKTTGFTLIPDELRAGYYSEIDIMVWAHKLYGEDFCNYLKAHYEPIDFVIRLAKETAIVLLNGDGFDGPLWSVRASLANLDEQSYLQIGTAIRKILDEYHAYYLCQK